MHESNCGELTIDPCNLCPRMCGARRLSGARGLCGADGNLLVARAALHYWEEPPVSGETGSGTVFFGGCPLRCVYCQNSVIADGTVGRVIGVERLACICLELEAQGALNVNFVTPTHYSLQIIEAVARARSLGFALPVVWNTSGYERVEMLRALSDTVDVYLTDFKYADADLARRYSHAPDYPQVAFAALEEMVAQVGEPCFDEYVAPCTDWPEVQVDVFGSKPDEGILSAHVKPQLRMTRGVIVRHLVLPGALDASKRAIELLYERFGNSVAYSIMNQYTPVISGNALERFPELGKRVASSEYEELLDFVDSLGLEDYFWQDGPADEESFIPVWDASGV